MKNDETTCYYESVFAAHMADFIRYKRAQGLKYDAVPRSLRSFSRFLSAKEADRASIGKELIEEWCSFRPNENRLTQRRRIVETTQFLKYLSERGVDVHLPRPTRKSRARGAFVPYIFSHEELRRFFEECDRISARTPSMMPAMLPVLFRLLLGCGLRISEALGLRLGDTDLDKGILVIRKSKFNKDRLIPLSDSLLAVLREYSATYHKISKDDKDPFFAHRDGRVVSQDNIYTWFRKLIWAAGISHGGRRWFVGLGMDDAVWNHAVFSKNRDRLLTSEVAQRFFAKVNRQAKKFMSDEHFTVDGTLIQAWTSQKSFRKKDGSDDGEGSNFHGQKRKNDTHESTTDPDARLLKKSYGKESKLSYLGHALVENRNGLIAAAMVTHADGHAERDAALLMLEQRQRNRSRRITVGADKAFDSRDFVTTVRELNVTPHVTKHEKSRRSNLDRSGNPAMP